MLLARFYRFVTVADEPERESENLVAPMLILTIGQRTRPSSACHLKGRQLTAAAYIGLGT
jgi:hypothetical protein